jgi:hypothetical protein
MVVIASVAGAALAMPAATAAARGSGTPEALVTAAISAHNAKLKQLKEALTAFDGSNSVDLVVKDCNAAVDSGDPIVLQQVEDAGNHWEHVASELRSYNASLASTAAELNKAKVGARLRRKLRPGLNALGRAHKDHQEEFFDLHGVGTDLVAHQCSDAGDAYDAAAAVGSSAWVADTASLGMLRGAVGAKQKLTGPVEPYSG